MGIGNNIPFNLSWKGYAICKVYKTKESDINIWAIQFQISGTFAYENWANEEKMCNRFFTSWFSLKAYDYILTKKYLRILKKFPKPNNEINERSST